MIKNIIGLAVVALFISADASAITCKKGEKKMGTKKANNERCQFVGKLKGGDQKAKTKASPAKQITVVAGSVLNFV